MKQGTISSQFIVMLSIIFLAILTVFFLQERAYVADFLMTGEVITAKVESIRVVPKRKITRVRFQVGKTIVRTQMTLPFWYKVLVNDKISIMYNKNKYPSVLLNKTLFLYRKTAGIFLGGTILLLAVCIAWYIKNKRNFCF